MEFVVDASARRLEVGFGRRRYGGTAKLAVMGRPMMTRRQAVWGPLLGLLGSRALGQQARGMGSRSVKALPRGAPSGLPFHAKFTNIAHAAGLRAPVVYGDPAHT